MSEGFVHRAFVGLGSNLNAPHEQIIRAFEWLGRLPRTRVIERSALYRTKPVGMAEQPDFINAAVLLDTQLEPLVLLNQLLRLEHELGRRRNGRRWGPRVIDLDLLLYDDVTLDTSRLQLPHPRIRQRAFVLVPLADIAPGDLVIPGQGELQRLLAAVDRDGVQPASRALVRPGDAWQNAEHE